MKIPSRKERMMGDKGSMEYGRHGNAINISIKTQEEIMMICMDITFF